MILYVWTAFARAYRGDEAWFAREVVPVGERRRAVTIDMRYIGQNYELPIALADDGRLDAAQLREDFLTAHRTKYGHFDPDAPVEIVNIRLTAQAAIVGSRRELPPLPARPAGAPAGVAPVWFEPSAPLPTPFFARTSLPPGQTIRGPAVITQFDATTLLPPGASLTVEAGGSLLIEVEA